MSRIAKEAVVITAGVEAKLNGQEVSVKGKNGSLTRTVSSLVKVTFDDGKFHFAPANDSAAANDQSGTERALVHSMVTGVHDGYTRKLNLVGVGYRAAVKGDAIDLQLGFSHPLLHKLPAGVKAQTPSATEIVLTSADKALLGQVAADIRAHRPPEPYKGKGIRYDGEVVIIKETKKK